jgi:hypothetical protein
MLMHTAPQQRGEPLGPSYRISMNVEEQ